MSVAKQNLSQPKIASWPGLHIIGGRDRGDISESLGPIHVSSSDPYRLDADGDELGCES